MIKEEEELEGGRIFSKQRSVMAVELVDRTKLIYGALFLVVLTLPSGVLYLLIGSSDPFLTPSDNSGLRKSIQATYTAEVRGAGLLSLLIFSLNRWFTTGGYYRGREAEESADQGGHGG